KTETINLHVRPGFNLTVSMASTSANVTPTGFFAPTTSFGVSPQISVGFTITVIPIGGFNSTVSFSEADNLHNAPTTVTAFSPTTVTGYGTTLINYITESFSATSPFLFTAAGGGITQSISALGTVTDDFSLTFGDRFLTAGVNSSGSFTGVDWSQSILSDGVT